MRISLCLALVLVSCASGPPRGLGPGAVSRDTIFVVPVRNLAGVSLKVPEMYAGDIDTEGLDLEMLDLGLLTEAALIASLRAANRPLAREDAHFQLHCAITEYEATDLRRTGRYRLGLVLFLVDGDGQEVARGGAVREFQLFTRSPDERGALGEDRFVRARMEAFTETLARDALNEMNLPGAE